MAGLDFFSSWTIPAVSRSSQIAMFEPLVCFSFKFEPHKVFITCRHLFFFGGNLGSNLYSSVVWIVYLPSKI